MCCFCYRYDFFLVSQSVRQGTVTPTHYNVIWDTTGLKPDHMQRLAYKMCHLYYNWPVSLQICYVILADTQSMFFSNDILFNFFNRELSESLLPASTPTSWPSWWDNPFTRTHTWLCLTASTSCKPMAATCGP